MSTSYNSNSVHGKLAFPLCPPDRIEEEFTLLEDEINTLEHLNVQSFSRDYIQYIRNTYMSRNYGAQGAW